MPGEINIEYLVVFAFDCKLLKTELYQIVNNENMLLFRSIQVVSVMPS